MAHATLFDGMFQGKPQGHHQKEIPIGNAPTRKSFLVVSFFSQPTWGDDFECVRHKSQVVRSSPIWGFGKVSFRFPLVSLWCPFGVPLLATPGGCHQQCFVVRGSDGVHLNGLVCNAGLGAGRVRFPSPTTMLFGILSESAVCCFSKGASSNKAWFLASVPI